MLTGSQSGSSERFCGVEGFSLWPLHTIHHPMMPLFIAVDMLAMGVSSATAPILRVGKRYEGVLCSGSEKKTFSTKCRPIQEAVETGSLHAKRLPACAKVKIASVTLPTNFGIAIQAIIGSSHSRAGHRSKKTYLPLILETTMMKQRPWGNGEIKACSRIYASSWMTSTSVNSRTIPTMATARQTSKLIKVLLRVRPFSRHLNEPA